MYMVINSLNIEINIFHHAINASKKIAFKMWFRQNKTFFFGFVRKARITVSTFERQIFFLQIQNNELNQTKTKRIF